MTSHVIAFALSLRWRSRGPREGYYSFEGAIFINSLRLRLPSLSVSIRLNNSWICAGVADAWLLGSETFFSFASVLVPVPLLVELLPLDPLPLD